MKKIILTFFVLTFNLGIFAMNVSSDGSSGNTKVVNNIVPNNTLRNENAFLNEWNYIGYIENSSLISLTLDPTASSPQTFCTGATVNDLVATESVSGATIQWYSSISDITPLASTTLLLNGTNTYYVSETISGTESARIPVTVIVNIPTIVPIFNAPSPVCYGEVITPLSTTSINGYAGTWSPALNNSTTTVYTFTPTPGQCATTTTVTIPVNLVTFSAITTTATCLGTNATITMNGLVPNSTSIVNYSSKNIVQPVITVVANASGMGTFQVLFDLSTGQEVTINSITRTDGIPSSCTILTPYYGNTTIITNYAYCTKVQASQCNQTLTNIDDYIYCDFIPTATSYRWRVTTITGTNPGQVQIIDYFLRNLRITELPVFSFGGLYKIEVATLNGGVWGPYGTPCNVSTPIATSKLINCNLTITKMNDAIYADLVSFTPGYRFKITKTDNAADTQIINTVLRVFNMGQLTGIQYNASYYVEVAVKNTDGTYMPYGAQCIVNTPPFPFVQIVESQCDYIVPTNGTRIDSEIFTGANRYRFTMRGPVTRTLVKNVNYFTLSEFVGLTPASTYNINVELSFNLGSTYGPLGKTCRLTIP